MAASIEDVEDWKKEAKEIGATHIISVCDTFDWDDYPVYVMPDENLNDRVKYYNEASMQQINEIIEIS